jgi:hypothetical protein
MSITRRTRPTRVLLAAGLALVAALGTVSAAPAGGPAPVVVAGGPGHCC